MDVANLQHKNPVSAYCGRALAGTVRSTWRSGVRIDSGDEPRGRLLKGGWRDRCGLGPRWAAFRPVSRSAWRRAAYAGRCTARSAAANNSLPLPNLRPQSPAWRSWRVLTAHLARRRPHGHEIPMPLNRANNLMAAEAERLEPSLSRRAPVPWPVHRPDRPRRSGGHDPRQTAYRHSGPAEPDQPPSSSSTCWSSPTAAFPRLRRERTALPGRGHHRGGRRRGHVHRPARPDHPRPGRPRLTAPRASGTRGGPWP